MYNYSAVVGNKLVYFITTFQTPTEGELTYEHTTVITTVKTNLVTRNKVVKVMDKKVVLTFSKITYQNFLNYN